MSRKLPGLKRTPRPDGGADEAEPAKPRARTAQTTKARAAKPKTAKTEAPKTKASTPKPRTAAKKKPAARASQRSLETVAASPPKAEKTERTDRSEFRQVPDTAVEILDKDTVASMDRADRRARRLRQARLIVAQHAVWSTAGGLIPLPYANVLAISGAQVAMVVALCRHYGHAYTKEAVTSVVAAIVGTTAPYALSAGLTSLVFRSMPVVGSVFGLATMAGLSNLSTRTLGKLFIEHFEDGNDLDNLDTDEMSRRYKGKNAKDKAA